MFRSNFNTIDKIRYGQNILKIAYQRSTKEQNIRSIVIQIVEGKKQTIKKSQKQNKTYQ